MKNTVIYLFIITLILSMGCTSTYHLQLGEVSWIELNEAVANTSSSIKLTNGYEIDAKHVFLTNDESYVFTKLGNQFKLPTDKINIIHTKNYVKGAFEGLGIGLFAPIALGTVIGAFSPGSSPRQIAFGVVLLGSLLAIPSALFALPMGTMVGHTDTYIINKQRIKQAKRKYIKVEITSIRSENKKDVIVVYHNRKIHLHQSQIKQIDNSGNKTMITVPMAVYTQKFK